MSDEFEFADDSFELASESQETQTNNVEPETFVSLRRETTVLTKPKETKVTYKKITDTAIQMTFINEDHTIGNLLRTRLLKDARVKMAGYRIPHPLENKMTLTIQTNGMISPLEAYEAAIASILRDCDQMTKAQ